MDENKKKQLEQAILQIEKQFGKGSIMRLGSTEQEPIQTIPSGSIALDIALGIGGLPRGRVIEVYGPEMSGKTTVALHVIAEAQKQGGEAAFIDAEHALDPNYASNLGVDVDSLLVSQPDNGEQALEITEALVRSGAVDVVVVDKLPASFIVEKSSEFECAALYYKGGEGEADVPTEESYAICVTKGQDELLKAINEVLAELGKEGIQFRFFDLVHDLPPLGHDAGLGILGGDYIVGDD